MSEIRPNLPWNYETLVKEFVREKTKTLCLTRADAMLLLRLNHKRSGITLCAKEDFSRSCSYFGKIGVNVVKSLDELKGESFNLFINQHQEYNIPKVFALLKKGGHFITEQIGTMDCAGVYEKILKEPNFNLENECDNFKKAGFKVVKYNQCYQFFNFSTLENLSNYTGQNILNKQTKLKQELHRFMAIYKKV